MLFLCVSVPQQLFVPNSNSEVDFYGTCESPTKTRELLKGKSEEDTDQTRRFVMTGSITEVTFLVSSLSQRQLKRKKKNIENCKDNEDGEI